MHVETERRERQRLFLFVFDCVAPACAQFNAGFDTDRQISWVTLGVCHPALFRHNRKAGETADCSVVVYADNHVKKKGKKKSTSHGQIIKIEEILGKLFSGSRCRPAKKKFIQRIATFSCKKLKAIKPSQSNSFE